MLAEGLKRRWRAVAQMPEAEKSQPETSVFFAYF
jgi:hypothetical protein